MNVRLAVAVGLVSLVFVAGVGQSVATGEDGGGIASVLADAGQTVAGADGAVAEAGAPTATPTAADAASSTDDGDGGGASDGDDADGGADDGGDGSSAASADGTGTATATGPPFAFRVDTVEKCGRTCRDVTGSLHNRQSTAATDVVVRTRMYAGNETKSGARVWTGRERIGRLGAGASHTSTQRVKLGWIAAGKVKGAGGWITVETTVETADRTWTVEQRRDVT